MTGLPVMGVPAVVPMGGVCLVPGLPPGFDGVGAALPAGGTAAAAFAASSAFFAISLGLLCLDEAALRAGSRRSP